jgi:hypothetical protein
LEARRSAKVLLALKFYFPAVGGPSTIVEELVGFLPWYLEANKVFSRNNRLSAFAAIDDCYLFHGSLTALWFVLLVGQFVLDPF